MLARERGEGVGLRVYGDGRPVTIEGIDFRTRTRFSKAGLAASVPSASEPVIGVSMLVRGPVGPEIAVPLLPKYLSISC